MWENGGRFCTARRVLIRSLKLKPSDRYTLGIFVQALSALSNQNGRDRVFERLSGEDNFESCGHQALARTPSEGTTHHTPMISVARLAGGASLERDV
jgi:hypothetical protein